MFSFQSGTLMSGLLFGHNITNFRRVECWVLVLGDQAAKLRSYRFPCTASFFPGWTVSSIRHFFLSSSLCGIDTEVGKGRLTLGTTFVTLTYWSIGLRVLTIKLNPSINFLIFVAHGRHTRSEKLVFVSKDSHLLKCI